MALIECEECGKEISDKATACPHCGAPKNTSLSKRVEQYTDNDSDVRNDQKNEEKVISAMPVIIIGTVLCLIFLSYWVYQSAQESLQQVAKEQELIAKNEEKKMDSTKCEKKGGVWNWNGEDNRWECHVNGEIIVNEYVEKPKKFVSQEGKRLSTHLSYNNEHYELAEYIKNHMHNPDSYEFVSGEHWTNSNGTFVSLKYRGTNGFGGIVTEEVVATLDGNGNIVSVSR